MCGVNTQSDSDDSDVSLSLTQVDELQQAETKRDSEDDVPEVLGTLMKISFLFHT